MIIDLTGKVGIVTGGTRGIGRATCEKLLEHNANVLSINRSKPIERPFAGGSGDFLQLQGDIGDPETAVAGVRQVFQKYKKLDFLICNAGILQDGLLGMIGSDDVTETLRVNLCGVINSMQASSRLLKRSNGGSIVNISSIIGRFGNSGQVLYGASKAGVIGATISASKELAKDRIRVNAIAPGYIETDMISSISEEKHQERIDSIAMNRIGKPEDVANVVLFLVSDMSDYVTGQIIGVDGGMLI